MSGVVKAASKAKGDKSEINRGFLSRVRTLHIDRSATTPHMPGPVFAFEVANEEDPDETKKKTQSPDGPVKPMTAAEEVSTRYYRVRCAVTSVGRCHCLHECMVVSWRSEPMAA